MFKSKWIGLGVGLLMIGGAFGLAISQGSVAFAQSPTPTPGATTPAQNTAGDYLTAFWNALATRLGIGVDDLKSKVTDAQKDVIEQAVTDGKITRAQADALEQRLAGGDGLLPLGRFPGGNEFPGRGNEFRGGNVRGREFGTRGGLPGGYLGGLNVLETVAQSLNLTPTDLYTQLQTKSLAEIAQAQNVSQATVKQAIIDAARAQLQRAVQDGAMTQAQADAILSRLTLDTIDLNHLPGLDAKRGGPRGPRMNQPNPSTNPSGNTF